MVTRQHARLPATAQPQARAAAGHDPTLGSGTALADPVAARDPHDREGPASEIGSSPRALARQAGLDALAGSPRAVGQRRRVQAALGSMVGPEGERNDAGGSGAPRKPVRVETSAAGEARPSRPLHGVGGSVAQRFPATVATAPIDWDAAHPVVAPLSGGAVSLIYKLTQPPPLPPGEVDTAIVKVLRVEEPDQVRFGEAFLRRMGLATPDDRLVMPGTPEFGQLAGLLGFAPDNSGQFIANGQPIGALFVMQDLAASGARTIVSQVMNAATRADIDEVFATMTDPVVLQTVARAMVCDTAIGNWDRITMDGANFGNLMIRRGGGAATQVFLIDTNARLPPIRDEIVGNAANQGGFYDGTFPTKLLKGLFDDRADAVARWIEAIPFVIQAHQSVREDSGGARNAFLDQEQAYIAGQVQAALPVVQQAFTAGIQQETARLVAMMSVKADPDRGAIKAAAAASPGQSFKTLKAQVGYLDQRSRAPGAQAGQGPVAPGDIGHAGAASIVESYGRYRLAKAVAAPPANAAQHPVMHAALAVPATLRASKVGQVLKGKGLKGRQAADFTAFHPGYLAFRADLDHHIDHLRAIEPLADNLRHLLTSMAEPGSTRNQRAMASLAKRQAQIDRLRPVLKASATLAVQWAANYLVKADQLVAELPGVSGRYDNLRSTGAALQAQRDRLDAAAQAVAVLRDQL